MKLSLRELRGLGIVATGGQIQRISDTKFIVKSQNDNKDYQVEWINNKMGLQLPRLYKKRKAVQAYFCREFSAKFANNFIVEL